jgi:hypothetical protein
MLRFYLILEQIVVSYQLSYLNQEPETIENAYIVETASGEKDSVTSVFKNCTISLAEAKFPTELMPMTLSGYDVILGMDWLNKSFGHVDCEHRTVTICFLSGEELLVHGNNANTKVVFITTIRALKCLR